MKEINYAQIIHDITAQVKRGENLGEVASYIPELAVVEPDKLGIYLTSLDNKNYSFGDAEESFSIQSISKVLSLTLALEEVGEALWSRVGVEPSGSAFNSLVQLEYEKGIPRNPLINAGAIVVCDILISSLKKPKQEILQFIRDISGDDSIDYNHKVADSERQHGFRNYSLAYLMKDFGNIQNDIDTVLDVYFNLCSIEMTCRQLSQSFLFLASDGISPMNKRRIVTPLRARRINSIMQMCGFYDEAGEFAFSTGLPGKSGVGGGIVAIHPGKYSVAVWSPRLNAKGNSYKGMKVLEELTTKIQNAG